MATEDHSTVVGVFEDRALAQRAIDELRWIVSSHRDQSLVP
jgi:hypothetical protein